MKVMKIIGIAIGSLVILLVIVNLLTGGIITYFYNEVQFTRKSHAANISKEWDVVVDRYYKVNKSYTYYCTRTGDESKCYIIYDYPSKTFYMFDYEAGRTEKEALEIANRTGDVFNVAELLIYLDTPPYKNNSPAEEDLKWLVYNRETGNSYYVDYMY